LEHGWRIIRNFIIPTDFHIFSEGLVETTNQQWFITIVPVMSEKWGMHAVEKTHKNQEFLCFSFHISHEFPSHPIFCLIKSSIIQNKCDGIVT